MTIKKQSLEQVFASWKQGAFVFVDQSGEKMLRAAAFVYELRGGGFAWVEPSYTDPWGGGTPAMHLREGPITPTSGNGWKWVREDGRQTIEILPRDPEDSFPEIDEALGVLFDHLRTIGKSFDEERTAVRKRASI